MVEIAAQDGRWDLKRSHTAEGAALFRPTRLRASTGAALGHAVPLGTPGVLAGKPINAAR